MIEQGFKFLDAFGFSQQNRIMFLTRESNQVGYAVVPFYAIQMMDYPTIRQQLSVCLLPNQDVFPHPSIMFCSGVSRIFNINIPRLIYLSLHWIKNRREMFSAFLHCTTMATTSVLSYHFPAIKTRMLSLFLKSPILFFISTFPMRMIRTFKCFVSARHTPLGFATNWNTTIGARMLSACFPFSMIFYRIRHISIIPYKSSLRKIYSIRSGIKPDLEEIKERLTKKLKGVGL